MKRIRQGTFRGSIFKLIALWLGLFWGTGAVAAVISLPVLASIKIQSPKTGDKFAAPGPVVIEAEAVDSLGDIRHLDFYANDRLIGSSDYLLKIAVIPGRPIPHRLEWKGVTPGTYRIVGRGKSTAGWEVVSPVVVVEVVGPAPTGVVFVPRGASWHWHYDGTDQRDVWRETNFDARGWKEGKAQLGFGQGDEATSIWIGRPPYPMTAYFLTDFQVPADVLFSRLSLRLLRSDGAVVYLNGKEVLRDNMPAGPVTHSTRASGPSGSSEFREFTLPAGNLVVGRNVVGVEVHQHAVTSTALSFDFALEGIFAAAPVPPVVSIEATTPSTSEPAPTIRVIPGQFTVRRTGGTELPLTVLLAYEGSAVPEADYAGLPKFVQIPAGKSEATLAVVAVDDDLDEPEESVIARIQPAPLVAGTGIALVPAYTLDAKQESAKVVIFDSDPTPGPLANLEILKPVSGDRFVEGETISVRVVGVDAKGYVSRVELFDGSELVGVSELVFIRAPDPGTPIEHSFDWKGAVAGDHKLYAKATSSVGTPLRSETVGVTVDRRTLFSPWLLNVNFGLWTKKTGPAGAGRSADDFWNPWEITGNPDATVSDLKLADGSTSRVSMRVRNAGGTWNNRTGDGMYDSYIYPNSGLGDGVGDMVVDLSGVPAGRYDLYLYGHADPEGRPESNSMFTAKVAGQTLGPLGTKASAGWKASDGWKEGAQYVVFRGVTIPESGAPLELIVSPGSDGVPKPGDPSQHVAVLNGLQLVSLAEVVPVPVSLEVAAMTPEVKEPSRGQAGGKGVFVVKRSSGPLEVALTVGYRLSGGASNGVDYARLSGMVLLPKGRESVEIVVQPLADSLVEGDEKVVLTLMTPVCPAIYPPPAECYTLGTNREASLVLRDGPAANVAPRVSLTRPKGGGVFVAGQIIPIAAEAVDPDGTIARLDILADGKLLGSTKQATLAIDWKEAGLGIHTLTARAVDDAGRESVSAVVRILVRDAAALAFVRRELPPAYLPGGAVEVVLVAQPPANALAWAVEEYPPAGWSIEGLGENGAFDRVTGSVRLGPFTDSSARRLTYRAIPPQGASGGGTFAGSSSLDGRTLPVAGSVTIFPAGEYHPADVTAEDHQISANELTAYAAAWKTGKAWGTNGAAIPLSYVTRAGAIWRSGGRYAMVRAMGAPPECWIPAAAANAGLPGRGPGLAGVGSGSGEAFREAPAVWAPGVPGSVTVRVTPPQGGMATALEEAIPGGWRVTRVSDGGTYDPASGVVRWGLLEGDAVRELGYEAVPPADAVSNGRFSGRISFDGSLLPILGRESVGASGGGVSMRIAESRRGREGHVHFKVEAPLDQVFAVEASSDLRTWAPVDVRIQTGEELDVLDPEVDLGAGRYYRLLPLGR